ncbi:hypothetical protein GCM10022398_17000 [Acetobacter lovaniensis]
MAVHKSTGGTRGPCDTTAKSLVARGPWEVPVELWAARRDELWQSSFVGKDHDYG